MISTIEKIITPNLVLRPYEIEDAEQLRDSITETLDLLLPWMPWAKEEPQTLEQKRSLIGDWKKDWNSEKDFVFGIFDLDGELVGSTGLHLRVGPRALETGYWMRKNFQRKGYATEAAYAMTKTGFLFSNIDQMIIKCDPANAISAKIPAKLGYEFIGETYSKVHNAIHLNYRMNRTDFKIMDEYEDIEVYTHDEN
ncbi:MAG: GNAT family N-acetyltransferase [Ignavibacteria bacterium]|nr:GNAT family N-acetyltransferase [Ignavibacteria bacterium]